MLHIKSAKCIHDKILLIEFEEYNKQYTIDMQDYIAQKSFKLSRDLQDNKKFAEFRIEFGVICWSNGFDIAPEYLFYLANKENLEYEETFREWGYLS